MTSRNGCDDVIDRNSGGTHDPGSKPSAESTGMGPADPHVEIMRWRDLAIKRGHQRDTANAVLDEIEAYVAEGMRDPHEQESLEAILSKRKAPPKRGLSLTAC